MMPTRIQRKRAKGWKKPENTVYVGRGTRWGNPFKVGDISPVPEMHLTPGAINIGTDKGVHHVMGAAECVIRYAQMMMPYTHRPPTNSLEEFYISDANMSDIIFELRGKNLMCWCQIDQPCHADWLLRIANSEC